MNLKTPLIDSHAHLDFDRFDQDREEVLERAQAAGVDTIISIGTTIQTSQNALRLAREHAMIYSSAGIHPHQADDFQDDDWNILESMWDCDEVVGIGETGLDYFYDYSDRDRQKTLFKRHLEAAVARNMPVIIHIRDAFDDAFELMASTQGHLRGIVHCFTGGVVECQRALDLGMHISLSGIVTFRNAHALREAVPMIPPERLLIETDSHSWHPYHIVDSAMSPPWPIQLAKWRGLER